MRRPKVYTRAVMFFLLLSMAFSHGAAALYNDEPNLNSTSAVLYEVNNGVIMLDKRMHSRSFPASTTKVMTALLALENCDPSETVTVTREAVTTLDPGSSIAGLRTGETLTMEDALKCLLVASGNDAAQVIAIHVGGSIRNFVKMMNDRAKELGCRDTNFTNSTGLHDEKHYSSAFDILQMTLEAMKYPLFMELCGAAQVSIPATNVINKERFFNNTNYLISRSITSAYIYSKAIGIKTGFTTPAGHCLVAAAKDGARVLVSVTLGAEVLPRGNENRIMSYVDTINLFQWGFAKFIDKVVLDVNEAVAEVKVELAKDKDFVVLYPTETVRDYMHTSVNPAEVYTRIISVPESLTAPIEKGQILGTLTLMKGSAVLKRVELAAANSVEQSDVLSFFSEVGKFMARPGVKLAILCIVIFLICYIIFAVMYNRRRRRKIARKRRRL